MGFYKNLGVLWGIAIGFYAYLRVLWGSRWVIDDSRSQKNNFVGILGLFGVFEGSAGLYKVVHWVLPGFYRVLWRF